MEKSQHPELPEQFSVLPAIRMTVVPQRRTLGSYNATLHVTCCDARDDLSFGLTPRAAPLEKPKLNRLNTAIRNRCGQAVLEAL